jgi:heme-degrading monooxygenase HmoA
MEAMMAISVMIQRTFSDKEKAAKLAPLIVKLRSMATIQPGYITGKTFRCLDCPGEYLVISTWNSLDDWNRWLQSDQRRALRWVSISEDDHRICLRARTTPLRVPVRPRVYVFSI